MEPLSSYIIERSKHETKNLERTSLRFKLIAIINWNDGVSSFLLGRPTPWKVRARRKRDLRPGNRNF